MAGPNTTGRTNPDHYKLGRGILYFAELDSNGRPKGWRDLGNAPEFNLNIEQETLEHRSSRGGLATTDKEVTISRDLNFNFQLEEFNDQNVAALFSGDRASPTNAAVAGFNEYAAYEDVRLGHWFDLRNSNGARAYDIDKADLTLKGLDYPTETALVEGTDYEVDEEMGRIFLLSSASNIEDGHSLLIELDANPTAKGIDEVRALTRSDVTGALKFIEVNPVNQDRRREWEFHRINLSAEGDVSMIGDDWSNMPFSGTSQQNEGASPDSPTLTVRTVQNAA